MGGHVLCAERNKNKFEINDVHTNVYKTSLKNGNYNIIISSVRVAPPLPTKPEFSRVFPGTISPLCLYRRTGNRGALAATNKSISIRECHTFFNFKHEYCYDTASSYIIMIRSGGTFKEPFWLSVFAREMKVWFFGGPR